MRKFKLIKEYPGSPKLGTEIIKSTIYGASSTKVVHTYMIKGDETFQLNNPKDYPEFWEEIVEKDYEILNYICKNNIIWRENKCHPNLYINNSSNINIDLIRLSRDLNAKIHSVKRLSDGEIFTIGDKVDDLRYKTNHILLKKIILLDNQIKFQVSTGINANWNEFNKSKNTLFTTEDGVDIYEGDEFFRVWKEYLTRDNYQTFATKEYSFKIVNNIAKHFSTKEKAEEYILLNKPCLSYNDIYNCMKNETSLGTNLFEVFKKLVKSKL